MIGTPSWPGTPLDASGKPPPRPAWMPPSEPWPPPTARLIQVQVRRPITWDHPGLLLALLGASFLLALLLGVLVFFLKWRPGMFVAEVGAFLIPAWVYARLTHAPWAGVFRVRPRLLLGVGLALVAAAGVWVLGTAFNGWLVHLVLPESAGREAAERLWGPFARCETAGEWTWTLLGMVVAAAVGEEILFRGLIQRGLERRWRRWPALVVTALIFAAIHLQPLAFPVLFVLGLEFGWLYQRTGSVWPGVVAHGANNFLAIAAFNAPGTAEGLVRTAGVPMLLGGSALVCTGALAAYGLLMRRPRPLPVAALAALPVGLPGGPPSA